MAFSDIAKNLRIENNLSQVQLAECLNVSKACISMIEIGKNEPTANTLLRYADYFHCTTDFLLGREEDFNGIIAHDSWQKLSSEEKALLDNYRKMNSKNRLKVSIYAEIRLEDQND